MPYIDHTTTPHHTAAAHDKAISRSNHQLLWTALTRQQAPLLLPACLGSLSLTCLPQSLHVMPGFKGSPSISASQKGQVRALSCCLANTNFSYLACSSADTSAA